MRGPQPTPNPELIGSEAWLGLVWGGWDARGELEGRISGIRVLMSARSSPSAREAVIPWLASGGEGGDARSPERECEHMGVGVLGRG
eukprot:scaffold153286_cov32-Tisochrysis_lutea.AAC.5